MTVADSAPMTVPEILSAMQALLDSVNASAGTDANAAPLTDDQANRYEELEGMLKAAQRTDDIQKRNAAYRTNVTSLPIAGGRVSTGNVDQHGAAFRSYLQTGTATADLAQYRAQGEATGAAGGFLVPEGFREKLIVRMKAFGGFGMKAEQLTTASGNPLPYPTVDDVSNQGAIVSEGNTFASGADLVFATRSLGAYKYMAGGSSNLPLKVSFELLADSAFDIESFLAARLGERLARKFATDWVNGSGVNEPQGVLHGGLSEAAAIASNTVGPTYLELVTIVHSLDPAYRSGASWVFNDATLAKINKLLDNNDRPLIWNNNTDLSAAGGGLTLLGYPVVIDQAFPDPSSANDFGLFGDIAQTYVVRNVKDVTLVTLNELYAPNGQVGYMAWARMDGMVQDLNASVLLKAA
jgi:HK97 family phage major capsid protein